VRLLDLFAGAQGAGVGYARSGFDVTAVDIETHARHPEVSEFVTADALEILHDVEYLRTFDVVHASPPCQAYSSTSGRWQGREHPRLIEPVRDLLEASGVPYVIENVPGAPLIDPLTLCGSMFDLGAVCFDGNWRQLRRHRLFESSVFLTPPGPCSHGPLTGGVYGNGGGGAMTRGWKFWMPTRVTRATSEASVAMGIDWMSREDIGQAIPPVYTEWIGEQLLSALSSVV
jgi:DNA (cytosine-5)-methyltransferase 1